MRSHTRDRFIGTWKLVSFEFKHKTSGEVRYPFGTNPVGRITYDAAGRMSAQLMDPGRRQVGGSPGRGSVAFVKEASTDHIREVLAGFISYFGTYDVDESSGTVTHHLEASLIPAWIGTDLRRSYEFSGNEQLTLTVSTDQGVTRLVWERDR